MNKTDEPWYSAKTSQADVILSTRLRIARNLADFPFVVKMNEDDKNRVNSLVYDSLSSDESFTCLDYAKIGQDGLNLLSEKCILNDRPCQTVYVHSSERISILVNETDHVKISCFVPGLDCEEAMKCGYGVDNFMQNKLQFAGSYDFGYLTSQIKDSGSGMKLSLRCFLPFIILSNKLNEVGTSVIQKNFSIYPILGSPSEIEKSFENCLVDIVQNCASEGTEFDQMADMQAIGSYILKTERKIRKEFADNNPTVVLNFVKQAYAQGMYAMLLNYKEGAGIISRIKMGIQTGVISGVQENELNALFYRTQNAHIKYLCDNYDFSFSKDVKEKEELRIQRLRTIVIQQILEKIEFND